MRYSTNATSGLVRWRCTVCRKKSPGMGSEARARDAAAGHYIGAHMGLQEKRSWGGPLRW
jgi:hypothetical protein